MTDHKHTRNRYDQTTSFVPALYDPPAYLPAPVPHGPQMPALLPTATTMVELRTTYTDRARGWVIATTPLAATAGITAVLISILGFAVPALSVAVLLVFFATFGGVWLLGWVAHLVIAPDGIALIQSVLAYRYVRHEQRHRHGQWRRI